MNTPVNQQMEEVRKKIRSYLTRSLKNEDFEDHEDIFKLGIVHSLFAVQLIIFIEKNFNVEIDDEDLDLQKIRTVNDILTLIGKKNKALTS